MPNGARGDHPLTDILHYGVTVFSPELDEMVKELDAMGAFESTLASLWLLDVQTAITTAHREGRDRDAATLLHNLRFMLQHELDRLRGTN